MNAVFHFLSLNYFVNLQWLSCLQYYCHASRHVSRVLYHVLVCLPGVCLCFSCTRWLMYVVTWILWSVMLYPWKSSYYNSSSVCVFVCSPTPPRSFDGSSPNLVGVCRWTSELPLRGSFLKRSTGQRVKRHFFWADDTRLRPHRCKRRAQQKAHGV